MEADGEQLLLGPDSKKAVTPTAIPTKTNKKLSKENKLLNKEVKKLKEHFASDKNLKQMK